MIIEVTFTTICSGKSGLYFGWSKQMQMFLFRTRFPQIGFTQLIYYYLFTLLTRNYFLFYIKWSLFRSRALQQTRHVFLNTAYFICLFATVAQKGKTHSLIKIN